MKILFIIGTGRCGSSFIHEILARHEHAGFVSNIDDRLARLNFKGRFNNRIFRSPLGRFTEKGRLRFSTSEGYELLSREISSIYADSSRDLTVDDVTPWLERRCRRFFEDRFNAQGKPLLTHKYTGWPRLGFFSTIFPEAKFIHIIRDGRSVANSWLQMPWWEGYRGPENWHWGVLLPSYQAEWLRHNRSFVALAGIGWKLLLDSYESGSRFLSNEQYMTIRYEDFVHQPRATMEQILSFSNLAWTDPFDKSYMRQTIHTSRSRAFERDLTEPQVRELESIIADKLRKYGYST